MGSYEGRDGVGLCGVLEVGRLAIANFDPLADLLDVNVVRKLDRSPVVLKLHLQTGRVGARVRPYMTRTRSIVSCKQWKRAAVKQMFSTTNYLL